MRSGFLQKHPLATLAILVGVALAAGCGKVIPIRYYDLRYPAADGPAGPARHARTLAIADFTASSMYRQSRILYREGGTTARVGFYDDRRWVGPPTELLTQAALAHFRRSNLFKNVVPYTHAAGVDYVLQGRITELEEVDLADGYYGRVALYGELSEAASGTVLWSGPLTVSRKTTLRDVDAIVEEIARGAADLLEQLSRKVDEAVTGGGSR